MVDLKWAHISIYLWLSETTVRSGFTSNTVPLLVPTARVGGTVADDV